MIKREHSPLELFREPLTDKEAATKKYVDDNVVVGSGGDAYYRHIQVSASTSWTVPHALGKYPVIQIVDTSGNMVEGDIHHDSTSQATLTFASAFSGEAYCC